MLRGDGYDEKVDLFSLGSVMFNMLTGTYLFKGKDVNEML